MKPIFSLNKRYLSLSLVLFLIEVYIALYVKDDFIRPYVGDVLVVIFLYTFIKGFFNIRNLPAGLAVLAFAFVIEFLQLVNLIGMLGWEGHLLARLILGTSFHWGDLLAYLTGIVLTFITEAVLARK